MLLVLVPITCVLSPQLGALCLPVGTLTVAFILCPHALVLVSILIVLDTESLLKVVSPVSDVLLGGLPDLSLDGSVLLGLLFLHPVDTSMGSILLSLCIVAVTDQTC